MKKERKMSLGHSNLDSGGSIHTSSSSGGTVRSQTHKLITPPYCPPVPLSTVNKRRIDDASSFRPGKIYVRNFKTTYAEEYKDPSTQEVIEYGVDAEEAQRRWEESRTGLRKQSLLKLAKLAESKFGNMGNMLRAVSGRPTTYLPALYRNR
jgi:hypothetical protein